MGSEFLVYLRLGFEHIADVRGYDHILFIVALTAMYPPREWLRVVVLVTAFTVGHTVTLALATLELVRISSALVELLIPITIIAAAALNVAEVEWGRRRDRAGGVRGGLAAGAATGRNRIATAPPVSFEPRAGRLTKYALALGFGLIHGLGFSNFLRAALGAESSLVVPLLGFNVGVEVGQISIVAVVVTATWLAPSKLGIGRRGWTLVLSGATAAVAVGLVVERLPF